jgi:hypothetical protein
MKSLEQIKAELDPIFENTTFYYLNKNTINELTRDEKLTELSTIIFNKFNGDDNV